MSTQSACVRDLMATLAAAGVRHVVVSPGSRSTPLVQAAAERQEFALHAVLDERSAAFFALGLARGSGALCCTLCTSGSAAAHVLPAAIEAAESGDALVAITADRPVAVRGLGAPQAIQQPGLLAPYAAHFAEVAATDPELRRRLAELQSALAGVRGYGGVVHVNVPLGLPLALTPGSPAVPPPRHAPPPLALPIAIPPPRQDERVLVIAGPLPSDRAAATFLRDHLGADAVIVAEAASGVRDGVLGPRHADALLRVDAVRQRLLPDRVVRLGAWPLGKGLQRLLEDARDLGVPVDAAHPRGVSDPLRQNRITAVGALQEVLRDWRPRRDGSRVQRGRLGLWAELDRAVPSPPAGWHEASILTAIAESLPADAIVHLGNSMPIRDWDTFAPRLDPGVTVTASRGAAGIDGALATLTGLAVGSGRPVVGVVGDCTFLHDVGSLQLLAQRDLRHAGIRVVVIDNDGGAIFDYLPARAALGGDLHRRFFTAPHGFDLARIAAGFGLEAVCCSDLAAWRAALGRPLLAGRVDILVAQLDRDESVRFHADYWRSVGECALACLGGSA